MENEVKNNNTKPLLIIIIVLLLVVGGLLVFLILNKNDEKEKKTDTKCAIGTSNYTIKFNTNGGNVLEDMSICKTCADANKEVSLPTPTNEGYKFIGWFKDSELTIASDNSEPEKVGNFTDQDCDNSVTTIYAKWEKIENTTEPSKTTTEPSKTTETNIPQNLSKKVVNEKIGNIKTNVVYSGSKKSVEYDEQLYVSLLLTGDGQYVMDHGIEAAKTSYGTYKISNNKLYLTQKYEGGSDCSIYKANGTYTFNINDNKLSVSLYDVTNLELTETDKTGISNMLSIDTCEVDSEDNAKMNSYYSYKDDENEVEIVFIQFNYYLMTYCNDATCAISYGTYTENNGTVTLNQTRYQGSDACYYKQSKTFKASVTKLSDSEIKAKENNYDSKTVYYNEIKINLNNGNILMPDKELTLTEETNTANSKYDKAISNNIDFFGQYCGEI